MAKNQAAIDEFDAAKLEMMRIRFRRVLGEAVASHVIKQARKNVAKCAKTVHESEGKNA